MNNRFAQSDRDQLMMFSRTLGDNLDKNHEIYAFVKLLDTEDDLILQKAEKYMKIKECLKRAEEFSLDSKINLTDDDGKFMKRDEAKSFYKKRSSSIEPIFGILKQTKNFREILLRGIQKARIEVKITVITFNFSKMIREQLV